MVDGKRQPEEGPWRKIVSTIPPAEYREACRAARRTAADPRFGHYHPEKEEFDSLVPHELASRIWDSGYSEQTKLRLAFRAYEEMPCYGHAMYFSMYYRDLSGAGRKTFWRWFRNHMSGKNLTLANPLRYSLWCDFFEHAGRLTEAWQQLVDERSSVVLLERVLESSGPAPHNLKQELYERLIGDSRWHMHIYRSIQMSCNDIHGSIDWYKAKSILKRLKLPKETEGLAELNRYMKNVRPGTRPKR
jgi:hypothetical protein